MQECECIALDELQLELIKGIAIGNYHKDIHQVSTRCPSLSQDRVDWTFIELSAGDFTGLKVCTGSALKLSNLLPVPPLGGGHSSCLDLLRETQEDPNSKSLCLHHSSRFLNFPQLFPQLSSFDFV